MKITISTRVIVHKIMRKRVTNSHPLAVIVSLFGQPDVSPRSILPHKRVNLIWLSLFQFLSNFLHDSAYLMPLRAPWGAKYEQLESLQWDSCIYFRRLHFWSWADTNPNFLFSQVFEFSILIIFAHQIFINVDNG